MYKPFNFQNCLYIPAALEGDRSNDIATSTGFLCFLKSFRAWDSFYVSFFLGSNCSFSFFVIMPISPNDMCTSLAISLIVFPSLYSCNTSWRFSSLFKMSDEYNLNLFITILIWYFFVTCLLPLISVVFHYEFGKHNFR